MQILRFVMQFQLFMGISKKLHLLFQLSINYRMLIAKVTLLNQSGGLNQDSAGVEMALFLSDKLRKML